MQLEQTVSTYKRELTKKEKNDIHFLSGRYPSIPTPHLTDAERVLLSVGYQDGYKAALSSLPPVEEIEGKDVAIRVLYQALEHLLHANNIGFGAASMANAKSIATAALELTKTYQP